MNKLEKVINFFKDHNIVIDPLSITHFDKDYKFKVEGPRNSIILYRIWGSDEEPIIDAWFGKSNSDSGGLGQQGSFGAIGLEQLNRIIKLHKRFMLSGRRKVLNNFSKKS